jgi:hypothetical protein
MIDYTLARATDCEPLDFQTLDRKDVGSAGIGQPNSGDDAEHVFDCRACGQPIDARDLGQVLFHEMPDHEKVTFIV